MILFDLFNWQKVKKAVLYLICIVLAVVPQIRSLSRRLLVER